MHRDVSGFYAVLGIAPDATAEAVRLAYRRRSIVAHPDNARTGSAGAFRTLRWAYDTLRDPAKRAAYDVACSRTIWRTAPPRREWAVPVFTTALGAFALDILLLAAAVNLVN